MLTNPISHEPTIGDALARFADVNAKDATTVTSALRALFGGDAEKSSQAIDRVLAATPLPALVAKFVEDGSRYTDETIADLTSRKLATDSHLKVYPRAVRRLIAFAEQIGFLAPRPTGEILPGWKDFLAHMSKSVPTGIEDLQRYRESGCKMILGRYRIDSDDIKVATRTVGCIRSAMKVLATNASKQGTDLADFGRIYMTEEDFDGLKKIAPKGVAYYYARECWNHARTSRPDLELPFWPLLDRVVSLPLADWHPRLRSGLKAALFTDNQTAIRRPISNKHYESNMTQGMGLLHRLGFDHAKLVSILGSPKAAVALLYGASPREFWDGDSGSESALDFARRLVDDEDLRQRYVAAILAMAGRNDGAAMVMGPFVKLVLDERYREHQYSAARKFIQRVMTTNKDYLELGPAHLTWVENFHDLNNKLDKRKVTRGKSRKKLAYRHPRLWKKMSKALLAYFESLLAPGRVRDGGWALDYRDAIVALFMLMYPLRVSNYVNMRLSKNFDREKFELYFEEVEVKNRNCLKHAIPERGIFEKACDLIDVYLDVARPLLLQEAVSDYFFVPSHAWTTAGIRLRDKGLNDVLVKVCKEIFKDSLPQGMEVLNPHVFRDIVAIYWIIGKKDWIKAAQFLCDRLETVLRHYSDLNESACEELKGALEDEQEEDE